MADPPGCCRPCATCLLCLYSCQWITAKKEKRRGLRTTKCDCSWFFFLFCVFLFTLVWLYIAIIILNDFHNFNEFIFKQQKLWLDWSLILLIATAVLITYSAVLLVLALCLQLCGQPLKLHWLHKVLLIITALVVAAAFTGLGIKWAEEWRSARISLQATGPFLHIGIVGGMTLLAWPLASVIYRTHSTGLKVFLLLLYSAVMIALYLAPLGITSPCIMEENQLPPKPALVGHRGAPMLAPENTLMSLRKAVNCDVQVFETDVMVSADGVPFLMHDEKLTRTTNVQTVFPERATLNSTAFNWTDLQQLNAGSWFLERRPFSSVQSLSHGDRVQATRQKIPSLEQVLDAAKESNISIMFDLRPENHSDYQSFVNATLEVILQSGIPLQQVLWLPDGFREQVKQQVPGVQQIYGRKRLQDEKEPLLHVNLPYQDMSSEEIKQYRQDNISVNLYVVNQPWLFSVLWCSGVSSVTTNACQVLKEMKHPIWLLPSSTYLMIWIVVDCVSFLMILWAFLLMKKCSQRRRTAGECTDAGSSVPGGSLQAASLPQWSMTEPCRL
ncbi:glycerophosphoinositol inositolphosphodiesterase GDPD2 isoform X1 [Centrocercus urophasianus]|uniref:glycerophosphoinositol inositolphosphodiesterase GDPD2 isoform X1 n=1 Tax=Centrocercus urophasianus TaxID=9002 RepID=UPI001C64DDD7|nr:glycerophosphoinositol inositolphosphodiesterase GDPD2 isoform X1 [Centrocercus urophasianus]XP_042681371.1 glycerophosphoinositol inositolphosphodiesterase GDPD2 isoform X1 [Centrocercus urophasianus]